MAPTFQNGHSRPAAAGPSQPPRNQKAAPNGTAKPAPPRDAQVDSRVEALPLDHPGPFDPHKPYAQPVPDLLLPRIPAPTPFDKIVDNYDIEVYWTMKYGVRRPDGRRKPPAWRDLDRLGKEKRRVDVEYEQEPDPGDQKARTKRKGKSREEPQVEGSDLMPLSERRDWAEEMHLDRRFFPPSLWAEFFGEGSGAGVELNEDEQERRRKRLEEAFALGDDDAEVVDAASQNDESDPDRDYDFDDDDDEQGHVDYDANYFENGESDNESMGEEDDGGGFD